MRYQDQSADAIIPRHTHVTSTDDVIPINDVTISLSAETAEIPYGRKFFVPPKFTAIRYHCQRNNIAESDPRR